jgi:hypothetical protein
MDAAENRFYREPQMYVIWSEEHGMWWRPGQRGYTNSLRRAGRYPKDEADEIVFKANAFLEVDEWHELAISDPLEHR